MDAGEGALSPDRNQAVTAAHPGRNTMASARVPHAVVRLRRIAPVALLLLLYALPSHLRPARYPADDSYFYLLVAENIVGGNGSTFNGVMPTNGYHPLWMLLCLPIALVTDGNRIATLHVTFVVQLLLLVALLLCARQIARTLGLRHGMFGATLLAAYFLSYLYASEAHVNGFLIAATFWALLVAARRDTLPRWTLVGVGLGLALLARLDNVFLAAALVLVGIPMACGRSPRALTRALAVVTPGAVIVAPYLAYNVVVHGHLMPISGAIKSTFPALRPDITNLGSLGVIVAILALVSILVSRGVQGRDPLRLILRTVGIGVLMHAAYIVLFTDEITTWSWYYVPGVLNAALLLGLGMEWLERTAARVAGRRTADLGVRLCLVLLVLAGTARTWQRYATDKHAWKREVAAWLADNLRAGEPIYVYEHPGTFAYYSNQRIVPIDGLINDYHYQDELVRLGVRNYLAAKGIGFYLGAPRGNSRHSQASTDEGSGSVTVQVTSSLYRRSVGALELRPADVVQRFSFPPYAVSLWRIGGGR